jgi:hypothetical protein
VSGSAIGPLLTLFSSSAVKLHLEGCNKFLKTNMTTTTTDGWWDVGTVDLLLANSCSKSPVLKEQRDRLNEVGTELFYAIVSAELGAGKGFNEDSNVLMQMWTLLHSLLGDNPGVVLVQQRALCGAVARLAPTKASNNYKCNVSSKTYFKIPCLTEGDTTGMQRHTNKFET